MISLKFTHTLKDIKAYSEKGTLILSAKFYKWRNESLENFADWHEVPLLISNEDINCTRSSLYVTFLGLLLQKDLALWSPGRRRQKVQYLPNDWPLWAWKSVSGWDSFWQLGALTALAIILLGSTWTGVITQILWVFFSKCALFLIVPWGKADIVHFEILISLFSSRKLLFPLLF